MIELNKVYNEDCLVGMQRIDDKSIDMILCDLPYGTTANIWDALIPFDKLWEQYERIIKDDGTIVLTANQPFTSQLVLSNTKLFKYSWVWKKSRPTGFLNAKKQPLRVHEDILVFYKTKGTYNPQGLVRINKMCDSRTHTKNYGEIKEQTYLQSETNYPISVLEFPSASNTIHPTQKPVELFEYLINTYTNAGELVLDNCLGSGTTALAAINTRRNYIGFELNKQYFDTIQTRIKEYRKSGTLVDTLFS